VAACCARGCDELFTERVALRDARRYRRKGLDGTARAMRDHLVSTRLEGATVLEVGGGVGALQLELLKAGAARGVVLELSPAYDEPARALARDAAVEERVERRLHDLAADPATVEPADVVVLHRVVCCYPDAETLLRAAAEKARGTVVFSYPPAAWWTRAAARVGNGWQRLRGRSFRAYVHDPRRMAATLEAQGLRRAWSHRGFFWHAVAVERGG
jgi:2-polyprenyl-3-methyl-5-hydroxy-6-metoxy-1,4-benzoquinol methylase